MRISFLFDYVLAVVVAIDGFGDILRWGQQSSLRDTTLFLVDSNRCQNVSHRNTIESNDWNASKTRRF